MDSGEVTGAAGVVFIMSRTVKTCHWNICNYLNWTQADHRHSPLSKRKLQTLHKVLTFYSHLVLLQGVFDTHRWSSSFFTYCSCDLPLCLWISILQPVEHRMGGASSVQCSMCQSLDLLGFSWGQGSRGVGDDVSSIPQRTPAGQQAEWSWSCWGQKATHGNHDIMLNSIKTLLYTSGGSYK